MGTKHVLIFGLKSFISHVVISLVQALLTAYDETCHSLVVEGDVLSKPFLDVGFDGVRWKLLTTDIFLSAKQ
jgi:hypothetical protein